MADEAPTTPPNGEDPPAEDQPPKWFSDHLDALDKRFEGLALKVRESQAAKPPPPTAPTPEPPKANGTAPAAPQGDPLALMRLGEARAKLTDEARQHLDGLIGSGTSVSHALELVDFATKFSPPANGDASPGSPLAPPGNAASAAPRTTPNYPQTQSEYMALAIKAKTDSGAKKRWDGLAADPGFDPESLKQD